MNFCYQGGSNAHVQRQIACCGSSANASESSNNLQLLRNQPDKVHGGDLQLETPVSACLISMVCVASSACSRTPGSRRASKNQESLVTVIKQPQLLTKHSYCRVAASLRLNRFQPAVHIMQNRPKRIRSGAALQA